MSEFLGTVKSIPFEEIISNPLAAIVQGESQAARATADFIREVGFDPPDKDNFNEEFGDVRMVFFKVQRTDTDGELKTVTIQVPLLSLVPIPAIQVKEAVIDFSVQIHDTQKIEGLQLDDQRNKLLAAKRFQLFGSISRKKTKSQATKDQETETSVDMNVKVTLQQADFPIGVMRLFDLLEQSITEVDNNEQ